MSDNVFRFGCFAVSVALKSQRLYGQRLPLPQRDLTWTAGGVRRGDAAVSLILALVLV